MHGSNGFYGLKLALCVLGIALLPLRAELAWAESTGKPSEIRILRESDRQDDDQLLRVTRITSERPDGTQVELPQLPLEQPSPPPAAAPSPTAASQPPPAPAQSLQPAAPALEAVPPAASPQPARSAKPAERVIQVSRVTLVSQQAEGHIRRARDLAERGAVYSAQAEFIQSLKLVAQALDTDRGQSEYSSALAAALRAFAEAAEFSPEDAHRGTNPDLERLIATHGTPALKQSYAARLTPLAAMQGYYTYAKEQLAVAAGHEPAASLALYGWARLQPALGGNLGIPRAVVLHQAALAVDARNYLAANELAVLMARHGEAEEARQLLLQSLTVAQRSETWHNLSVVHQQLGQKAKAEAAAARCRELFAAERARQRTDQTMGGMIYWVDAQSFAQQADPAGLSGPAPNAAAAARPKPAVKSPAEKTTESSAPLTAMFSKSMKSIGSAVGLAKNPPAATDSTTQEGVLR